MDAQASTHKKRKCYKSWVDKMVIHARAQKDGHCNLQSAVFLFFFKVHIINSFPRPVVCLGLLIDVTIKWQMKFCLYRCRDCWSQRTALVEDVLSTQTNLQLMIIWKKKSLASIATYSTIYLFKKKKNPISLKLATQVSLNVVAVLLWKVKDCFCVIWQVHLFQVSV